MAEQEINEIRRIRHEISQRHRHDVKELVKHYQQLEEKLRQSGRFRFTEAKQTMKSFHTE